MAWLSQRLGEFLRYGASTAVLIALCACAGAQGARAAQVEDLSKLSIEELGKVQVTSVSKRAQAIGQAASSVYVISHDDIVRSGATTLPEVLRLAPNLEVQQQSASGYVITARGMNGVNAAQNFSNKLLVLIDGRTVYSPLYSGVYWDMQDVLLQDIDRIEVISGPGATLWGANAVNGVINIITRDTADTQGGFAHVQAGNQEGRAGVRFGGRISDQLTYRLYADTYYGDDTVLPGGGRAHDHWSRPQGGFRFDWTPSAIDTLTLQGDGYGGSEAQAGGEPNGIHGGNLTARWRRAEDDGSSWQVQAYYDRAARSGETSGTGFWVDTYDLDVQRTRPLGARQQLVYGGGFRSIRYEIFGTQTLQFAPDSRTLQLGNAFVQDSISLPHKLNLVLGLKVEDDPYVGPELLPDVRLSWTPSAKLTVWSAISRAIRSPTPFDRDVVELAAPRTPPFLTGGHDFQPETLTGYELGAKIYPSSRWSFSLTTYFDNYNDLRSIEITPTVRLPLHWGNGMQGHVYGVEAWGQFQATPWWRLSGSFTGLHEDFWFKPGASGLLGPSQAANDPRQQASLGSSMTFQPITFDASLRYQGAMPNPRVAAYTELDARIGWMLTRRLTLALDGRNLLHKYHLEYAGGYEIPRSVLAELQWRF